MRKLAIASITLITCCSRPEILPISSNVYLISASALSNSSSKKNEIIKIANNFARSKGKIAVAVSLRESHPAVGMGGQFEYQFKLVDPDSPEAQDSSLGPMPVITINKNQSKIETKDTSDRPKDIHSELLKLDDLRKRKIITEEEFQSQKKKLLDSK